MTGSALTFPSELLTIKRSDVDLSPGLTWTLIAGGQTLAEAGYPGWTTS